MSFNLLGVSKEFYAKGDRHLAVNAEIAPDVAASIVTQYNYENQRPHSKSHVLVLAEAMRRSEFREFTSIDFAVLDGVWNGKYTPTDVDNLDLVNATRLAYANQLGVSEQDVIRFEKTGADHGGFGRFVSVHCNHPGCSMSKGIGFNNPAEMLQAEQRASKEIWYCHHHREVAFASEGALADELLPVLHRIAQSPGLTQKATGAKKEELSFLEAVGLVRIEQLAQGNRVMCYQIFITESGQEVLDKFSISSREE